MTYKEQLVEEKVKLELLRAKSPADYEEFNIMRSEYDQIDFNIIIINKEIEIDGILDQLE